MKDFYEFASNSPFLTFFLAYIIFQGTIYIVQAIASAFKKK